MRTKIPYYYDLRYIQLQPLSIKYWLGDGVELKDDGEGCYIAGDFSKDGVGAQLEYAVSTRVRIVFPPARTTSLRLTRAPCRRP